MSESDSLDESLHDRALHDEVVLTAHLIIASNEVDGPLGQDQIDQLLGLDRRRAPASALVIPGRGS